MAKYSRFKNLTLLLTFKIAVLSIQVPCWSLAGKQTENGPQTSSQLTVRHVLDMQRPPFINLTPSRPTIVQFPSEVSNCVIKSNLISLAYGNGESVSSSSPSEQGSKNQGSGSSSIYSAVTLSVGQVENFTYDDMMNVPETYMICSIKSNIEDSFCQGYKENQNSYCYVTVGIKISDPEHYNAIVYLDKPGSNSALAPIPTHHDLIKSIKDDDQIPIFQKNKSKIKTFFVKNEDKDSIFKIDPFPKNRFKEDRILGVKADKFFNELREK